MSGMKARIIEMVENIIEELHTEEGSEYRWTILLVSVLLTLVYATALLLEGVLSLWYYSILFVCVVITPFLYIYLGTAE